jgi:hypothetical protein
MEVNDIASLATIMTQTQLKQQVGIAVLKKALDMEGSTALTLIQALPTAPSAANLPANLGQNINTTA